jgi:ketosteroid isomerase-like protein
MYRFIVKRLVRRSYRQLSSGNYEAVLKLFGPSSVFFFAGTHELGGERRGVAAVREVFRHIFARFPGLQLEPQEIVVSGAPWNTRVAVLFVVRATLSDGEPYRNEGMQFLRLRWGRVVEDRLYEDTQKLAAVLERAPQPGTAEASIAAA